MDAPQGGIGAIHGDGRVAESPVVHSKRCGAGAIGHARGWIAGGLRCER